MRRALLFVGILIAKTTLLSAQDATDAEKWLTTTIKDYFAEFPPKHLREISTERYAEYKQDAICVVYECDNSLTREQFNQKWDNIYDTTYAGIGEGFLIDQQDWENIEVSKCVLISQPQPGTFIFDTIIAGLN